MILRKAFRTAGWDELPISGGKALFGGLFLEVLLIEDVPFPAPLRHIPGKRTDLVAGDGVCLVLCLEVVGDCLLYLAQGLALVREINEVVLPDAVWQEVGYVGYPVVREPQSTMPLS